MASDAGIRNVAEIFNYGPGVIGHAFNDLVVIALPLYAYLLAKLISWLDRNALGNAKQPIPFVLLMGCAPAQMLAMARGELGCLYSTLLPHLLERISVSKPQGQ